MHATPPPTEACWCRDGNSAVRQYLKQSSYCAEVSGAQWAAVLGAGGSVARPQNVFDASNGSLGRECSGGMTSASDYMFSGSGRRSTARPSNRTPLPDRSPMRRMRTRRDTQENVTNF